jgi:hypothetical protein
LFTEVTLEAAKSYSSTSSSSGKLVFNINKEPKLVPNKEEGPKEADPADFPASPGVSADNDQLDTVDQARSKVVARRAPAPDRGAGVNASVFGRKKR